MKIAFIGPAYPLRGGIAEFLMKTAEKSIENGHQVKIFSFQKQYPKLIFPGKDQFDKSAKDYPLEIERTLIPYNPLSWNKGIQQIIDYQPDLVILKYWIPFFSPMYTYIINQLRKFTQAKIMYIIHNIEFHEKWLFADQLSRMALRRSDYLVSLSNSVYESIQALMPEFPKQNIIKAFHPNYEVSVLNEEEKHNSYFDLSVNPKKTILFFGYIKHYKGLDILIKAFRKVIDHRTDIQLLIAGEVYGQDKKYFNLITNENLQEHIVFHNHFIKSEDIPKYFAICDVVVQPYRTATQSGVSLLALSYNKPVISTQTGALDEIIIANKNGILVAPEDPNSLAQAIIDFYEKYDRESMIQFIKEEISTYSWNNFIKKVLEPFTI